MTRKCSQSANGVYSGANRCCFKHTCKYVSGTMQKCCALCCFKQKLDPEVQRMRRNQSALQYERRHRELKGRVERLEEDLQVRGDRLYADSAEIGIVGGVHDGMRFPGPAKVKVVAFLEVLSY